MKVTSYNCTANGETCNSSNTGGCFHYAAAHEFAGVKNLRATGKPLRTAWPGCSEALSLSIIDST